MGLTILGVIFGAIVFFFGVACFWGARAAWRDDERVLAGLAACAGILFTAGPICIGYDVFTDEPEKPLAPGCYRISDDPVRRSVYNPATKMSELRWVTERHWTPFACPEEKAK